MLNEFGLFFVFLLKLVFIIIAILFVIAGVVAILNKEAFKKKSKISVSKLNEYYDDMFDKIHEAVLNKTEKKGHKKIKKERKHSVKQKRIFVINYDGDMRATEVKNLREEVTAILTSARPQDEVFVSIESGGGYANAYGLGASQLQRIKDRNIKLTVAVDRVAASGGYLMACVADKIIAAPFAIIGSIGVVGQLPNFSKLLKEKHVDYELLTSGKYKRTLTMFGENTEDGRNKFQQDINELHEIFKVFIKDHRNVDIDKVGTGEYWCAIKAKELNLVDELMTSDEYLMKESADSDIFEIKYNPKKTLGERFADATTESLKKAVSSVLERDKNGEMFYF